MTYEDIILEEAEDLLHFDSSVLLEASGGSGSKGSGGGKGKGNLSFFGKIQNGQFLPGSSEVKKRVKFGALRPYGFENVDITDTKKLKSVMVSIRRRRDIEASRALLVGAVEGVAFLLFGGISNAMSTIQLDPSEYGTKGQEFVTGVSDVFRVMSIISGALALFTEIANMVDAVKASKAIGQVRQNIMDAYDRVSVKIMNTKPGTDQKSVEAYHAMLSYRDALRECQLKLGSLGGFGADNYITSDGV